MPLGGFGREYTKTVVKQQIEQIPVDPEKMEEMITMYYKARGWDPETGLPTPKKLTELGLKE